MLGRASRWIAARSAEILFAVGLVVVFFLVFMGLLSFAFPRGTSLVDLLRSGTPADRKVPPAGATADDAPDDPAAGGGPAIAVLSYVHHEVKDKAADAIAWSPAIAGSSLGNYHAVQTFENSAAAITFSGAGEIRLGENTLIILKKAEALTPRNRRLASIRVMGGELRGAIAAGSGAPISVEIESAAHSATIRPDAGSDAQVEFGVRVNPDASSTLTVFQGRADVSSQSGTTTVAPNQAVRVDPSGSLGPVTSLPPAPAPLEPEDGARVSYRGSRSRMHFAWRGEEASDGYLLTVARDAGFRDVVSSDLVQKPESLLGNLRAGTYYWRVSVRRIDLDGPSSATRTFRIVRDLAEPELRVDFPARVVSERAIVLTGEAEPGTKVFINNVEIPMSSSGRFSHALTLERGINVLVVEAIDAAGNVAYRSATVDASQGDSQEVTPP